MLKKGGWLALPTFKFRTARSIRLTRLKTRGHTKSRGPCNLLGGGGSLGVHQEQGLMQHFRGRGCQWAQRSLKPMGPPSAGAHAMF